MALSTNFCGNLWPLSELSGGRRIRACIQRLISVELVCTLPVLGSQRTRAVIICPQGANSSMRSWLVMCLGRPPIYRLAPLILSQLGRASDTCMPTSSTTVHSNSTEINKKTSRNEMNMPDGSDGQKLTKNLVLLFAHHCPSTRFRHWRI